MYNVKDEAAHRQDDYQENGKQENANSAEKCHRSLFGCNFQFVHPASHRNEEQEISRKYNEDGKQGGKGKKRLPEFILQHNPGFA
jgi:hypothetical protein